MRHPLPICDLHIRTFPNPKDPSFIHRFDLTIHIDIQSYVSRKCQVILSHLHDDGVLVVIQLLSWLRREPCRDEMRRTYTLRVRHLGQHNSGAEAQTAGAVWIVNLVLTNSQSMVTFHGGDGLL